MTQQRKSERRGLIASVDLEKILDDEHWLAFECSVDEAGAVFWKYLVCSENAPSRVVITQRQSVKTAKTLNHVVSLFREIYPTAPVVEIPILDGEIAPKTHPAKKSGSPAKS